MTIDLSPKGSMVISPFSPMLIVGFLRRTGVMAPASNTDVKMIDLTRMEVGGILRYSISRLISMRASRKAFVASWLTAVTRMCCLRFSCGGA